MAIPEVICFRVVTQDLSYNYICRRWTPNWGCPCRKQYVLLQETMAQTAQAACALDMSCVSWQTKSSLGGCWIHILSWIRKTIWEKQTRAAWLINFKHHHEEFWISWPGQKNQEFVSVKSAKDGFRFEESRVVSCLQKRIYKKLIFFRRQKGFHLRRCLYKVFFVSSSLVVSLQRLLFDLIRSHCSAVSLKHQGMRVAQWVSLHLCISVADSTVSRQFRPSWSEEKGGTLEETCVAWTQHVVRLVRWLDECFYCHYLVVMMQASIFDCS